MLLRGMSYFKIIQQQMAFVSSIIFEVLKSFLSSGRPWVTSQIKQIQNHILLYDNREKQEFM
jgi:hypothetical protein